MDPVRELKVRAELLQHAARALEPPALQRLRALAELRRADVDALSEAAAGIPRKHCLAVVAREVGFASFDHARRVLDGDPSEADFGTLLYGNEQGAQLNHWFAAYDEARAFHVERSTAAQRLYLLAYKRQFFVVEHHFIEALGLDPGDRDWEAIGWDWVRPKSVEARRRLYGKLLDAQRPPPAGG
jgi:hypothetical protein